MPAQAGNNRNAWKPTAPWSGSRTLEAVQRFLRRSYAGDYLGLVILIALYLMIEKIVKPFHQMFLLDDPRIQHPHAEIERVGVVMLFVYAMAIPLGVQLVWTLVYAPDFHKAHVTTLGLLASVFTTTFITDVIKNTVGRPRPDLIDRCKPEASTPTDQLVTIAVCTETAQHLLQDGFRSFPSGHSSFAFAGLGWLALFFASQTSGLRARASLTTALFCLVPMLGATLIAVSRLEDYRHDVFDVTVGSLIGFAMANFHWRRYFPSLLSVDCSEPYSAQTGQGANTAEFDRVRDEEEAVGQNDLFEDESEGRYNLEGMR